MNEQVLVGGGTVASLKANCEAMTNSVLQFSAIWYGPMVAALIFATRAVLARRCRDLAAEKLIDETFAGASPQAYFERYRTYLLAPAIAQQLLEVVGK